MCILHLSTLKRLRTLTLSGYIVLSTDITLESYSSLQTEWVHSLAAHLPNLETVRFGSHQLHFHPHKSKLDSPQVWIVERDLQGFEVRSEATREGRKDEGYVFAKEIDPWGG